MRDFDGRLYILSAASGTGKTSLAKALAETIPQLAISISHTTRPIRAQEEHNKHYYYVTVPEFQKLIAEQQFLEYAQVFGNYYGTSRAMVERNLAAGIDVLLDIDWQGAQQVRQQIECTSIFLLPPSRQELRRRLEGRKREDQALIEERLGLAKSEMLHYKEFDYVVINDDFASALAELQAIILAQRLTRIRQEHRHVVLFNELLATDQK